MPAYDSGLSNGTSIAPGPTEPVAELWQVTTGTTLSAPVVANETLYVGGTDGDVLALDARTGNERWRRSVGTEAFAPWVVNDALVVPIETGVVVLDPSDGTERWQTETPDRADNLTREGEVDRPTILVASHGVYWIADEENPVVVSIALEDGEEQWRTEIHRPWTRRMFASDDSLFISTDHNERVPWMLAAETGEVLEEPSEPGADFEDERYYRDGTVYAVDDMFGRIEATAVDDRGQSWDQALPPGEYALSGNADRIYVNTNGDEGPELYALSATDGTVEWSREIKVDSETETERVPVTRPVVAGESVLVNAVDRLRSIDPVDGTERWSRPNDDVGDHLIVADGLVYTTQDDTVRAFR